MRAVIVTALVAITSSTVAAPTPTPTQLPDACGVHSPVDVPCTSFTGRYHLKIEHEPGDKACVVDQPVEADITIGKPLAKGEVQYDAKSLAAKLGLKPTPKDDNLAGASLKNGVCCVQVRIADATGPKDNDVERRLFVSFARGGTKAVGRGDDRREIQRGNGTGGCGNRLVVEVTVKN